MISRMPGTLSKALLSIVVALYFSCAAFCAPKITVSSPDEGATLSVKKVVVKGNVKDESGITDLIINGRGFEVNHSKSLDFEKSIALGPGDNIILITVLNAAGEISEKQLNVFVDSGGTVTASSVAPAKDIPYKKPEVIYNAKAPGFSNDTSYIPAPPAGDAPSSELVAVLPAGEDITAAPAPVAEPTKSVPAPAEEKKAAAPEKDKPKEEKKAAPEKKSEKTTAAPKEKKKTEKQAASPAEDTKKPEEKKKEPEKKPAEKTVAEKQKTAAAKKEPSSTESKKASDTPVAAKEKETSAKKETAVIEKKKPAEKKAAAPEVKKANATIEYEKAAPPPVKIPEKPMPAKKVESIQPKKTGLYSGECHIIIARSYLYEDNAHEAAKSIAKKGYETSVFTEKIGDTNVYHLVLGFYINGGDARYASEFIRLPGYKIEVRKTMCKNMFIKPPAEEIVNREVIVPAPPGDELDLKNNIRPIYIQNDNR